jgi:hypothetical protein
LRHALPVAATETSSAAVARALSGAATAAGCHAPEQRTTSGAFNYAGA